MLLCSISVLCEGDIKSLSKEKKLTSKDIDNMLLRKKAELETETSQL